MNALIFIQIVVSFLLVSIIIFQKTASEGFGGHGSASSGLVNIKTADSFLIKLTMILASIFMINAIILANMSNRKYENYSIPSSAQENEIDSSTKKDLLDTDAQKKTDSLTPNDQDIAKTLPEENKTSLTNPKIEPLLEPIKPEILMKPSENQQEKLIEKKIPKKKTVRSKKIKHVSSKSDPNK